MITKEYIFSGIVQGMGFRPTALRLATELGITGTVCNTGGRVTPHRHRRGRGAHCLRKAAVPRLFYLSI